MKNLGLSKVLLLGSGALKIGQAGEFDYSGAQALKTLREEGIETILLNPNIATVQTSEGVADRVYFLPVTAAYARKVIEKERPDGILLSFGGQTALNTGVELYQSGVLEQYGVQVLGTPVSTIMDTEDRERFVEKMAQIQVRTIPSHPAANTEEALRAAREIGYPVIIRSAYALGGLGSGFADNEQELRELCGKAFSFAPQVLVEKSLQGWEEIEFEVVRDAQGAMVTVCDMENFDPLGIHTGESIVVAPCQSLPKEKVKSLSQSARQIVEHLGIVGECNLQFACNTDSDEVYIIEVNARLSRSSALASKATGYPLAAVAAKIALGYTLSELGEAALPPSLDYMVCKIPRWDLSKFHGVSHQIGSSMKSVGEVMAIGRCFEETIQKGLRMVGQGIEGFVGYHSFRLGKLDDELSHPTDIRIFALSQALQEGWSIEQIYQLSKINPWFLERLQGIVATWEALGKAPSLDTPLLQKAKSLGFSDRQIASARCGGKATHEQALGLRNLRIEKGIVPFTRKIRTLQAPSLEDSNYLYLTYNATEGVCHQADEKTIVVLGSGAYRIGSSVEFDWCSVTSLQEVRRQGYSGVMINYNPETVSTDYDVCDRLYFEELSFERVMDILAVEKPAGVIVSVGGQIPNNLALPLQQAGVRILGTSATDIDRAEDRHKFSSVVDALGIDQPRWKELSSMADVESFIGEIGFPVLVRPSYVLSGAAMNICRDASKLTRYLSEASEVSPEHPVVISQFIPRSKEMDFDAVADGGKILCYAISEHLEYAGTHSGDATIVFPAQKLYTETVRRIRKIAVRIAAELHITGPFNIQFLAKENHVKVIECNLRASRSFPFVSKVLKVNFIELATQAMLGLSPQAPDKKRFDIGYVGVKSAQFSYARLPGADPLHSVDMASTGEAACLGSSFEDALVKSLGSVGVPVPVKGVAISSGDTILKADLLPACRKLNENGYTVYATEGTWRYLYENGIKTKRTLWPSEPMNRVMEETFPKLLDLIHQHKVDMVINFPKNFSDEEIAEGYKVRRAAVDAAIPLFTDTRLASAFIEAFCSPEGKEPEILSWEEYK